MRTPIVLAMMALFIGQTAAAGQSIDLVTLPSRETVQLTIYNSDDLTLAKETRAITLKKGRNQLQFSWAGTLIDPTSVQLRPLQHADEIEITDTVFLGQKPQHLIWNIESEYEGEALVEVSYFTSGLTWTMDYVAIANLDETTLRVRGHVRVFNNSGEEYRDAEIRLIVGKINLVEKIADLAKRRGVEAPSLASPEFQEMQKEVARQAFGNAKINAYADKDIADKPKQIVKEGVSEYFMFIVEGTETVPNGWSKRMPAVRADLVQFDIVYRMRDFQYGPKPVRFFNWKNDKEHKLGDSPLPNGIVRVFRENGRDGLSFLGQQTMNYVPIQADIEINLGPDALVVLEKRKTKTWRDNFDFYPNQVSVAGWDEHQKWITRVRNYTSKPIALELRLQFPGDVEFKPRSPTSSFDFNTVETKLEVTPSNLIDYVYTATIHHGNRAKQNRVLLKLIN